MERGFFSVLSDEEDENLMLVLNLVKRLCSLFLFLMFFLPHGLFSEEVSSDLERNLTAQTRALFSSFESGEKPLTVEQHAQVAHMTSLLLQSIAQHPSGQYLTLLGDGNYYLGDFGRALYFWRCAELRFPHSVGLHQRIALVRTLLQLDRPWIERPIADTLGLTFLPMTMRFVLLLACMVVSLFLWLLWLIFKMKPFFHVFVIVTVSTIFLLLSVTWYEWVLPPRVIMLKSTELKGSFSPGAKQEIALYQMKTGEEAEVLSVSPDKSWLRIRTVTKQTGYVPGSTVGFVE